MKTRREFAEAYLAHNINDARKQMEHAEAVYHIIMDEFPERIPDRIVEMCTTRPALLGKLRKPRVSASMMLDTVFAHLSRQMDSQESHI